MDLPVAAVANNDSAARRPAANPQDQRTASPTPAPSIAVVAPTLDLPKGGGAIRGIGEKFSANPVNGTATMAVPLATTPGRNGLGPELSLAYDSGAGNGSFGLGWSLGLPSISRRTDRGLPRYDDAGESDVFVLSGAEDLVPAQDGAGERLEHRAVPGYVVLRFRPRVEASFARIERWTQQSDGDVHWRAWTGDNVLTIFGRDSRSRIADPTDPTRVFSWLVCERRDDRGNAVLYDYKPEDGEGIDLTAAHEGNRGPHDALARTANRYPKRIRYGNVTPLLDDAGRRPRDLTAAEVERTIWCFTVLLDYGEHDWSQPAPTEDQPWTYRPDPFGTCRPGFEVRTGRRCQRVLMFHNFPAEPGVGADLLVRSTELDYGGTDPGGQAPSLLRTITRCGYRRQADGHYLRRELPPLEFDYSEPVVQNQVHDVDPSLEKLPSVLSGAAYLWTDLYGEGLPGLLSEQASAWFYQRNLAPISAPAVRFGPAERVPCRPNVELAGGRAQLLDVAGRGRTDVVLLDGPTPGFYGQDDDEGWTPFRPFTNQPKLDNADGNLRSIDLTGDGLADLLITEDGAFVWHPSLAEAGYGPAVRVAQAIDDDAGPQLVFSDAGQSVYTADMNGDGLADLVRIRNGEVSYWPSLGFGRFGLRVSMDRAPHFDDADIFAQHRLRLADVTGAGCADLIYLGAHGVTVYLNSSGNGWAAGERLAAFPTIDDLASIEVLDLLGNGTACLVWSSALPAHAARPLRYVDLMGGQKPYLLVRVVNNLGAETHLHYRPSTFFSLADRAAGAPWITRLPFPVHVVDRVDTVDRISGNRFVTRYAYHHGYYDSTEREFRGFGLVEQRDTESFAALTATRTTPSASNVDEASHSPPVLTKTWFHTGHDLDFHQFAGEYYREPDLSDEEFRAQLLSAPVLPGRLTPSEQREALRSLKGTMLRQEIFAEDGTNRQPHPYQVVEHSFDLRLIQPRAGNPHAVFFTHPREVVSHAYEREPDDPRIGHILTLTVDSYGAVICSAAVGYGRRRPDPALATNDQRAQADRHATAARYVRTNAIDTPDDYRTPQLSESLGFELAGLDLAPGSPRVSFDATLAAVESASTLSYEEQFTAEWGQQRLISHVCTRYRPDDLGVVSGDPLDLLPLGRLEPLALFGESYRLALTPGLLDQVFGDLVDEHMLATDGGYVHADGESTWWQPSGRTFLAPGRAAGDDPRVELAHARAHFYLPQRFRNPFHRDGFDTETVVTYDPYDLAVVRTTDALGSVAAAELDYRVLQPRLLIDPNGNRTEVAFDALGLVVGSAVMGKTSENNGDSLTDLETDVEEADLLAALADPLADPHGLLQRATTRVLHDVYGYFRTRHEQQPQPAVAYALTRETHDADLSPGELTRIQQVFSYSDGFGREMQRKLQAEAGPLHPGGPTVDPRWVGSGWTVVNNKGAPVRQYEPFFSDTHRFEFARSEGISPVLCYDPLGRIVATLHPNHTWQKVVIGTWRQEAWDVNDLVLILDPTADSQVGGHFTRLPEAEYRPSWYEQRISGEQGPSEQAAAQQSADHAATPSVTHLDSLGRAFLSTAQLGPPEQSQLQVRTIFDIDGRPRELVDPLDRVVRRTEHDLLGQQLHSLSIDAGDRWTLADVGGRPRVQWTSRGHRVDTEYDVLGRPESVRLHTETGDEIVGRTEYGEDRPDAAEANLRGRPFRTYDGAGVVTTAAFDFTGNPLTGSRQFCRDYRHRPDWSGSVPLEPETFLSHTTYDALHRPVLQTCPDGSIVRRRYNQAGLLERLDANLQGETEGDQLVWQPFVTELTYNARGQRDRIRYGNGVVTTFDRDPLTFRLTSLQTRRNTDRVQELTYHYDPVGNITHVHDTAQARIFFRNRVVEASHDYRYDALYRLSEATGREHLGQLNGTASSPTAPDAVNLFHAGLEQPGDGNAMARYQERYGYDQAGNLTLMQHLGTDPAHPGWTRTYRYDEVSLLDNSRVSNRLTSTHIGDSPAEAFSYDPAGNVASMSHLSALTWDFLDQLESSSRQTVGTGTPETTHYRYDGHGQRARKITDRQSAAAGGMTVKCERRYLGDLETYREFNADGSEPTLARETLHLRDADLVIALVETRTAGDDGSPPRLTRYQLGNHLGSVSLELDADAELLSYEEYLPYGATCFQSVSTIAAGSAKRYRYCGKERDEESGLYYHGARYLAPWLGRWTTCDPGRSPPSTSPYVSMGNNPIVQIDDDGRSESRAAVLQELQVLGPEGYQEAHREQIAAGAAVGYVLSLPPVAGTLQIIGGLAEYYGGALVAIGSPDPVSKVGAAAMIGHGADMISTGVLTLMTGTHQKTLTATGGETIAKNVGASPGVVAAAGIGADLMPSLGGTVYGAVGRGITRPFIAGPAGLAKISAPLEGAVASGAANATEIIVPVPRPGMIAQDVEQLFGHARVMAEARGAGVVPLHELGNIADAAAVRKITFFGHGDPYVLGQLTADDLHHVVSSRGLAPDVIELAGCRSGGVAEGFQRAFFRYGLGTSPLAPRMAEITKAKEVIAYPQAIYFGAEHLPPGQFGQLIDLTNRSSGLRAADQIVFPRGTTVP